MRVTHLFAALFIATTAVTAEPKAEVKNPELRDELQKRGKAAEEVRERFSKWRYKIGCAWNVVGEKKMEFDKLHNEEAKLNADNAKWLGEQVDKTGWPTITQVGKEAAGNAWWMVFVAHDDPKFQRKCLGLMAKLPKGEVEASAVADLADGIDSVLLIKGEKQVYGTQLHSTNGKRVPKPIEDEANVDKRRAEVGLPPLADYIKQLNGPSQK